MPFAAMWMSPEVITLSEVTSERERQMPYNTTCIQNLKYEIETDSQTEEEICGCHGGNQVREGWTGAGDQQKQTLIYRMDK